MADHKPFNIALIEPPGYAHSQALGEVQDYLAAALSQCGYPTRASINSIADNEHTILLCAHLLPEPIIAQLPRDVIIFNSEKLEHADKRIFASGVYHQLLASHWVWDYSSRNLAAVPHARTRQIPLYYSAALKRELPRDPDGPLLFYGVMTAYRIALIDRLRSAGVPVIVAPMGRYGEERDRMMFAAAAVLNLHTDNRFRIFEPVRCFHPLINQIPVISEDFHDEPMFDLFRQSMFVTGNDVAADIVRLLADRPAFKAVGAEHSARFADSDPLPAINDAIADYLASRD